MNFSLFNKKPSNNPVPKPLPEPTPVSEEEVKKMKEQIEKGSTPATIFYLKTRGKKRGYGDSLDITSNDEPITIEFNIESKTDTNG